MSINIQVIREGHTQILKADQGTLLSDLLVDHGYQIKLPCGGMGRCGKCKVQFLSGVPKSNKQEAKHFTTDELKDGWRLSCKAIIEEDATVMLPYSGEARIVERGQLLVEHIDYQNNSLNHKDNYGVAIDLGTTTIVCYLVNLQSGTVLSAASALNPQKSYGDNVITRCDHIKKEENGLEDLRKVALQTIDEGIDTLAERHGITKEQIKRVTLVGNTIMQHIICGEDPSSIAVAPFTPVFTEKKIMKAKVFGLNIDPEADTIIAPALSGYIGGDTLAAVKAVGMDQSDSLSLLIDIGTNGEIVLGNKDGMLACSAAAGPAFEGAHIRFGIGGVEGAINKVTLNDDVLEIATIEDKPPIGICGSGLVDAVAALKELGILQSTGKLDEAQCQTYDGEVAYHLIKGIYIMQKDIREIQLAKSAIAAGINVLVEHMDITYRDIEHLYLAGGFGSYLNIDSATSLGLIDSACQEAALSAGNAAGMGAIKMLLSDHELEECEAIKNHIEYIELSMDARFNALFIEHMML